MKKYRITLLLLMVVAVSAFLFGCKSKTDNNTNMGNPMVEIQSASEFESKLGIKLSPNYYPSETKLFIIGDSIAHITYVTEGVDGNDVTVILRASKSSEDISGVYDENITTTEMTYGNIAFTNRSSLSNNTEIYDFSNDGINYCLIIEGEVSQMTIGEILDSTMLVCGLEM